MRLTRKDLTKAFLRKHTIVTGSKGQETTVYGEGEEITFNVQPNRSYIDTQIYGDAIKDTKSVKYIGNQIREGQNEKDGICLFVGKDEEPDYFIASINEFSQHTNIVLEKVK